MASIWYGTDPGAAPLAAWEAQDGQTYTSEADSAPLDVIRDRLAEGMRARLVRPKQLTAAFGHLPGAIGAVYPFAVVMPENGISVNPEGLSEPLPGLVNETGVLQAHDIGLIAGVAVAPMSPDWARLTTDTDQWLLPLADFFSQNRSLGQTAAGCTLTHFTYEDWPWGEQRHFLLAAHLTVRAYYRLRAH